MKIEKSCKTVLNFGSGVYTNTYVSSYAGNVEIDVSEVDVHGVDQKFELYLPIDKARMLAKELVGDLESYDKEVAQRAEEEAREKEEAEA